MFFAITLELLTLELSFYILNKGQYIFNRMHLVLLGTSEYIYNKILCYGKTVSPLFFNL